MKHKRIFAMVLCGIMLMAGCGESAGDSGDSQNVSAEISSVESSSSTVESTPTAEISSVESSTEVSSKSYTVLPMKSNLYIVHEGEYDITFECRRIKTELSDWDFDKAVLYEFDSNHPNGNAIQEKKLQKGIDTTPNFSISKPSDEKSYCVKFFGEYGESMMSNSISVKGAGSNTGNGENTNSKVHQYSHTFTAPNYITIIPDYDDALDDIAHGVQPKFFTASAEFTCPTCRHQKTIQLNEYPFVKYEIPYSKDDKIYINIKCGMSNCRDGKKILSFTIKSHAIKIS